MVERNKEIREFLSETGFTCEEIENHGLIAYNSNVTLLLSQRRDGCYAAKATSLDKDTVLAMFRADTVGSLSDRQIGWWAYGNADLPSSDLLDICNHDHTLYELKSAVNEYLRKM